MFAQPTNESEAIVTSALAKCHLNAWESLLNFRILVQKPLDLANKLPAFPFEECVEGAEVEESLVLLEDSLVNVQNSLYGLLKDQSPRTNEKIIKSRKTAGAESWDDIVHVQDELETKWKTTLNKWHSKTHFGSEKLKDKLTVFNINAWDQILQTMNDENRAIEKSRVPLLESERIGIDDVRKEIESQYVNSDSIELTNCDEMGVRVEFTDGSDEKSRKRKSRDLEVYDDRAFYSVLLKVRDNAFSSFI
jgi:hypothetical protein